MKKDDDISQFKKGIISIIMLSVFVYWMYSMVSNKADRVRSEEVVTTIYNDTSKQYSWIENGKDVVRSMLKDGESAKFKDVYFSHAVLQGKNIPAVCGQVNSKNSFGGYGGFQRFISTGQAVTVLEEQVKTSDFPKLWEQLCFNH